MGAEEQYLFDEIHRQLNPVKGWTMGYGFDLWEWVTDKEMTAWHAYLWGKPDWNHLLGARASKNELDQLSEAMDYSGYETHKPWYDDLVEMINARPGKPSFSEDRYRIRTPSKYPDKDFNEEETLHSLWHHTMAGGVAAIWGKLDGTGEYENREALKCFSVFWNDHHRFGKDMVASKTDDGAFCLADEERSVYYKENTDGFSYQVAASQRKIMAVDTRKSYQSIHLGPQPSGMHIFRAPYNSDWALVVE